MAVERAIDKLRKAFRVDARSSYAIKSGDELILKLYWTHKRRPGSDQQHYWSTEAPGNRQQPGLCNPDGD